MAATTGFILALTVSATAATTDAQKCTKLKLVAAGKYAACRLIVDAEALKKGTSPDYAKCEMKLDAAFAKAEQLDCGVVQNVNDVRAFVADGTAAITRMAGGAPLPSCASGCPEGQVAATGSGNCEPCPANAYPDTFARSCSCAAGYLAVGSPLECVACPEGADCTQPGTTCANVEPLFGYWTPRHRVPADVLPVPLTAVL